MSEFALFPLNAVLFPGGPLPLRIFEPRYVDMISRSLREDRPFGVCLIRKGSETGRAKLARVGTFARIVDWNRLEGGLLGIVVHGGTRFEVGQTAVKRDGLTIGDVTLLPDEPRRRPPAEWRPLVRALRELVPTLGNVYRNVEGGFDDAAWVAWRFAEILSLPLAQKQVMLEMTNPLERLRMLHPLVEAARRRQWRFFNP
jgi:Lon protease-like protein